jgi:hypothetical protein
MGSRKKNFPGRVDRQPGKSWNRFITLIGDSSVLIEPEVSRQRHQATILRVGDISATPSILSGTARRLVASPPLHRRTVSILSETVSALARSICRHCGHGPMDDKGRKPPTAASAAQLGQGTCIQSEVGRAAVDAATARFGAYGRGSYRPRWRSYLGIFGCWRW